MTTLKNCFTLLFIAFLLTLLSCKKEKVEPPVKNESYDEEHDYNGLSEMEKLGKKIFFDKALSSPGGQSCASCHNISSGFTDPSGQAFSHGAINYLKGNRSAPSISYMRYSPSLYYNTVDSTYMGGLFWDGRVNSLELQAIKPMLNPIEMNNANITQIVNKLQNAEYSGMFTQIYGSSVFEDTTVAIQFAAAAIAAYERSFQVNPFSSKYDLYLKGEAQLTAQELNGLNLFMDTLKGKCANCHPATTDNSYGFALFTDFSYDNIGVPHNPSSPTSGPDLGLGAFIGNSAFNGQFKVPTLRNVAISAPYFHNGYFNTLEEVVRFYSDRDSVGLFPAPEVNQNVNKDELGKLNLKPQEVNDLVAFLKTLTDGYKK
jgi:cytochrome c peroxidase